MKKNFKNISVETAILKYLSGDLSESDRKEFEEWLNNDPENRITHEEIKKIWEHSVLIKDFQSISIPEDWVKVRKRMNFESSGPSGTGTFKRNIASLWRVAAVLILFLGIGFLIKQYVFAPSELISISTDNFKKEIQLPDGSQVFLNKYSEIRYPQKFKRKIRQVKLSGEGYFEIAHNPDKLFRINLGNQAFVEDLGTSFNIRNDQEQGLVNVAVISGRVAFYTSETENNKTILDKDEEATLQNGSISKEVTYNKNLLSWKTGILVFDNDKIETVMDELTKFYNKKFIFKGTGGNDIRFTSTFNNQELESVIEEINIVLNLDFTEKEDTVIFFNSIGKSK